MGDLPAHDLFVHVRVAIGIVLGLSITRLLAGLARMVQHPAREAVYLLHLAWVFAVLLFVIDFWWWEFALSALPRFSFELFVFVIFYASLFYFLCALLFPDDIRDYAGYQDYFMSRRRWFFGFVALTEALDVVDTFIKGDGHLQSLGPEYLPRIGIFVLLCGVAAITRNLRFHALFVFAAFVYELSFFARYYATLN